MRALAGCRQPERRRHRRQGGCARADPPRRGPGWCRRHERRSDPADLLPLREADAVRRHESQHADARRLRRELALPGRPVVLAAHSPLTAVLHGAARSRPEAAPAQRDPTDALAPPPAPST